MSTLRPYQVEACKATLRSLKKHDRALVVMPTGTGKTRMAASIVQMCLSKGKRVLWLAHRKELIEQAAEALFENTGHKAAIEKGQQKEAHTEQDGELPMLVCASVQSMYRRLDRFDPRHFRLVVADECHHTLAKSWSLILEHFTNAKIVGLTATPNRADKRALGEVFQDVAYVLEILPAIQDGWLVPLRQLKIETEYDLGAVRTTAGDLNAGDLQSVLTEIKALQSVAVPLVEHAGERPTIVFAVTILHARLLGEAIQKCTERTVEVLTGETPDDERDDIMRRFRDGDVGFLVNVGIATEGVDLPVAACIAMARPTKSEALYAQCLDEKTEILTDWGWLGREAMVGTSSRPAVYDPKTETIRWGERLSHVERDTGRGEEFVTYKSPTLDIRVTDGHRMLVAERHGRSHAWLATEVLAAAEILEISDSFRVPVAGMQSMPDCGLAADELRLLGIILSDGHLNPRTRQIAITQNPGKTADEIERLVAASGVKFTRKDFLRDTAWRKGAPHILWTMSEGKPRGRDKHLTGWGAAVWARFLSTTKRIGPEFEQLSASDLGAFLEGLNLGDGQKWTSPSIDWTPRGYDIFINNRESADRLQSLCVRRGWRCNIAARTNAGGAESYMIHMRQGAYRVCGGASAEDRPIFQASRPSKAETVWCIETDAGTIVTRRNGKVTIMGNCLGRGTRPLPGLVDVQPDAAARREAIARSAKPDCLILDFVGNSGRHTLVHAIDIFAGSVPEPVLEVAKGMLAERPELALQEAIEAARAFIQDAELAELQRRAREHYRVIEVSPFLAMGIEDHGPSGWGQEASEKQLGVLIRMGVPNPESYDRRQASRLIGEFKQRRTDRKASYKQCAALIRNGVPPPKVRELSFQDAGKALDAMRANSWNLPREWHDRLIGENRP